VIWVFGFIVVILEIFIRRNKAKRVDVCGICYQNRAVGTTGPCSNCGHNLTWWGNVRSDSLPATAEVLKP